MLFFTLRRRIKWATKKDFDRKRERKREMGGGGRGGHPGFETETETETDGKRKGKRVVEELDIVAVYKYREEREKGGKKD